MRVHVIANPARDPEFVRVVRELARHAHNQRGFEDELRSRYARATVMHGSLSDEDGARWYVYRDGHWAGDSTEEVATAADE